jgi:transposase
MKLTTMLSKAQVSGVAKYVVTLTADERAALERLTRTGKAAARTLQHARILLKADASPAGPGWTDDQIQEAVDVSHSTIVRVRKTFVEAGVEAAIRPRKPQAVRPRKVDGVLEARLIALACSPVPDGQVRWTLRLLAEKFVELEGGIDISHETVRQVLGKKRVEALAARTMVHSTGGEWRLRVSHGRRVGRVPAAV